jgi:hypothetical protein
MTPHSIMSLQRKLCWTLLVIHLLAGISLASLGDHHPDFKACVKVRLEPPGSDTE